jgi:hypothetical protein
MDYWCTVIVAEKNKKVVLFSNSASCAQYTKYLFIWERDPILGNEKFHIRYVTDDNEYKTPNQENHYVPHNLRWFKDRNWNLEYDEKLHFTALGGSYGDLRDEQYVLTAVYKNWMFEEGEWMIDRGDAVLGSWTWMNLSMWLLYSTFSYVTCEEFEKNKDKDVDKRDRVEKLIKRLDESEKEDA